MPNDDPCDVRYMVDGVAAAVDFYTTHFGFTVGTNLPAFAVSPAAMRGYCMPGQSALLDVPWARLGNLVELFQPAGH